MPECFIALGGNDGDVPTTMRLALQALQREPGVEVGDVSRLYLSAAVGPATAGDFQNAAAKLSVDLSPQDLLLRLQAIEKQLGRIRTRRWGPRSIDLDLILFGQEVLQTRKLTIPHPHCWYRRFVIDPLLDLEGLPEHPSLGETFADLRARLRQRPLLIGLAGGNQEARAAVRQWIQAEYPDAVKVCSERLDTPPAMTLSLGDEETARLTISRTVSLRMLPGSITSAARAVLTAALDEPVPQSRPLLRIP